MVEKIMKTLIFEKILKLRHSFKRNSLNISLHYNILQHLVNFFDVFKITNGNIFKTFKKGMHTLNQS
jgi:hypothetical protein